MNELIFPIKKDHPQIVQRTNLKEEPKLDQILGLKQLPTEQKEGAAPAKGMLKPKKVVGRRAGLLSANQTYKPSDFFTRENYINKQAEKIPHSTENVLIVPPIHDGWGYIVDFYDEKFCGPIGEELYKHAIRSVNKVIQTVKCKKRANETKNFTSLHNIMLVVGLVVLLGGFGLCEFGVLKKRTDNYFIYAAAGCFGAVGLLSIGLFLSIFVFKEDENPSEIEIFKMIAKQLEEMNSKYFQTLGYEWKTPSRFYWLELHRLKKQQADAKETHPINL